MLAKRINERVQVDFMPTFYPHTVFRQHAHSQKVHSAAIGPLTTALYTTEQEGVRGDNSIVYDFYALAARWTLHAKIYSWLILSYL